VELYIEMLTNQAAVIETMSQCSQPGDKGAFMQEMIVKPRYKEIRDLGGPRQKYDAKTEMRVLEDSCSLFGWFTVVGIDKFEQKDMLTQWAHAVDFKGANLEGDRKTWY
jgi:hypothetical protein